MKFFIHLTFILLSLTITSLYSQTDTLYEDSLCEFTWNSDINNCPDTINCIYLDDEWNDQVFIVPFNITHISREGLEICLEDLVITKPVDIIYIMDLSGSMITTGDLMCI